MSPQPPRILLVDDEQSVQKLLSYPLRKEGYEVVAALDGQQALDRVRDQPFDLVVLDVMLPKMDGFEVCRRIRAHTAVPIIMLTAKATTVIAPNRSASLFRSDRRPASELMRRGSGTRPPAR